MSQENKKGIDRRRFLQVLGVGALTSTASIYGFAQNGSAVSRLIGEEDLSQNDKIAGPMTYRINPKSGEKVSLLGYGCMRWPVLPQDGDKKEGGRNSKVNNLDQVKINELVDYAIAHGVTYFDTAPAYGFSEVSTGIALSRHPRTSYTIATKMSNFDPSHTTLQEGKEMFQNSLKALQVDYIDYYLLHGLGMGGVQSFKSRFVDNGLLKYLEGERKSGRIRNLGWSYHGDKETFDYLLSTDTKWDFVQIQLNYLDWDLEKSEDSSVKAQYLYEELAKRNIPVVIMEPLRGGSLAKIPDYLSSELKSRRSKDSIASWAFRFAGSLPGVLTVLSGMTYIDHLKDNLSTFSPLEPVTDSERALLTNVSEQILKYPTVPCTGCRYCMPCPMGVNIPQVFAHYNKCVNEGNVISDKKAKNFTKARNAYLRSYDESVPKEAQASHCISCGKCVSHCPQRIRIPKEMARINQHIADIQ